MFVDNITMQIPVIRCELRSEATKVVKLSWLVVFVGDPDDFLPNAAHSFGTNQLPSPIPIIFFKAKFPMYIYRFLDVLRSRALDFHQWVTYPVGDAEMVHEFYHPGPTSRHTNVMGGACQDEI